MQCPFGEQMSFLLRVIWRLASYHLVAQCVQDVLSYSLSCQEEQDISLISLLSMNMNTFNRLRAIYTYTSAHASLMVSPARTRALASIHSLHTAIAYFCVRSSAKREGSRKHCPSPHQEGDYKEEVYFFLQHM